MNPDEQIAYKYLQNKFGTERIIYEPNGNIPPDFLVPAGPAVEVRRLNRHDFSGAKPKGVEERFIPLRESADSFLKSLSGTNDSCSWFVFFRIRGSIKAWKKSRDKIRDQLLFFQQFPDQHPLEWQCNENIRIELAKCTHKQEYAFVLGSVDTGDQAYWVVSELVQNIQHCAEEKLKKISKYKDLYPEWWLVLIDHIAFRISKEDKEQLFNRPIGWEKVVLVGGHDANQITEI